ncbi:hypothetical protein ACFQXA_12695 [Nocardiopsis composta]
MSPTPSGLHRHNVWLLDELLHPHLPPGTRTEGHLEVRMFGIGRSVIPDLFVAPVEVLATPEHWVPPKRSYWRPRWSRPAARSTTGAASSASIPPPRSRSTC